MKTKIFAIIGSASKNSSNHALVNYLKQETKDIFEITIFDNLTQLPHFETKLTENNTPQIIIDIRNSIEKADGVLFCTPEYIFSIPSGLKNLFEWCVSTTVFRNKPTSIITASAHGIKGHEELKLILKTLEAEFNENNTLLIQGVKGKTTTDGGINDESIREKIIDLAFELQRLIKSDNE